jgi:hypothetical protein
MDTLRISLLVFLFLLKQSFVFAQEIDKINNSELPTYSFVLEGRSDHLTSPFVNLNEQEFQLRQQSMASTQKILTSQHEMLQVKNHQTSLPKGFELSRLVQEKLVREHGYATPISFDYITLKKSSKPIITAEGDSIISTIDFSYPLFKNQEWDEAVNGLIFSMQEDVSSVEEYMDNFIALADEVNSDLDFASSWFQEVSITVEPQIEGTQTLSLADSRYEYSGGAHPNSFLTYSNFDIVSKQVIQLEDLIIAGGMAKLTSVGNTIFRKQEGLTPTQSLDNYFFENNKFSLNTNFLITDKGLMFFYNTYEIRSYAEGPMELLLPYGLLKGIIKPNPFLPVTW